MKSKFFLSNMALYNLGCEAIVRGTLNALIDSGAPNARMIMPSYFPELETMRMADLDGRVEIIPMSRIQRGKRFLLRKTGLFSRVWTPRFDPKLFDPSELAACLSVGGDMYTLYKNDLPWDLVKLGDFSQSRRVPFMITGASMEGFEKRPDLIERLLKHLKSAELITTRDHRTTKYLKSHGVVSNVTEISDPAFLMNPIECDYQQFMPKNNTGICVGINLSPLSQSRYPSIDIRSETVKGIEQFVDASGGSVMLVSHVFSPTPNPNYDDKEFHQEIHSRIAPKYRDNVSHMDEDIGAPRVKYILSRLDAYAATRMHSTIASMSMGVPTLALAYSDKAYGLNELYWEDDQWILPIRDFNGATLSRKLLMLLNDKEVIRKRLAERLPSIKQRSLEGGKLILDSV